MRLLELIGALEELAIANGNVRVVAGYDAVLGELEQPTFDPELKVVVVDVDDRRYIPDKDPE